MEDVRPSEIIHEVETIKSKILKFREDISNKNVIGCLGNTRSGKSTLINFILKNDLTSFVQGRTILIKSESNGNGPCIKHGCTSHTKYPSIWQSRNDDTILVDFPGFDDNRGVIRNIINTLFMNQLSHATSVKFVIVSDIQDLINDNVNEFTKLMTNLESIITDFRAVSLIFTKASDDSIVVANICSLLEKKILNVDKLAVKKDLITHLTENRNQIGILRAPSSVGLINPDEIDCNVTIATGNNNFINGSYQFALPAGTHRILLEVYRKFLEDLNFEAELNQLVRTDEKFFNIDKYVFASTDQELETTKNRLSTLLQTIEEHNALFFTMLRGVYESVSAVVQRLSEPFEKKLKFLKFMDELSLVDEKITAIVINRYRQVLSELRIKITQLVEKIDSEHATRLEEGLEHLRNVVYSDAKKVAVSAMVYVPLAKQTLAALGQDISWISWELVEASGPTFGIGLLGVVSFGSGAYATHYYNTTHLRKKLRKEQGRC